MNEYKSATDLVCQVEHLAHDGRVTTIGHMVDAFGTRGFGPLICIPAMIEITPLGGIPGLPSFIATFIALIAVQILVGKSGFWLPGAIRERHIEEETVTRTASYLHPLARRMDQWFGRRLRPLTVGLIRQLAAVVVIALCLTVPFLELIPFASSAPMLAIAVIGFALTVEDGLLMLVGMGLTLAALIVAPLMLIWA